MPTIWDEMRGLTKEAEQMLRNEEQRYGALKAECRSLEARCEASRKEAITDSALRGVVSSGDHFASDMARELLAFREQMGIRIPC